MTTQVGTDSFATLVAGRLLCYVAPYSGTDVGVVARAAELTSKHSASGLVVRGSRAAEVLRCVSRLGAVRQAVVIDAGLWTKTVATPSAPFGLPADEDVLVPVTVDEWASSWLRSGAAGVVTPSGFVESGNWPALKAVLVAGAQVRDPRVATLIATDADMLAPERVRTFLTVLGEQLGGRALALVFAAKAAPLASKDKVAGLRAVIEAIPGSLVMCVEVPAAADVVAYGGAAAVGLLSSQRKPNRPQDEGSGGFSPGYRPGMFLRELWETRNPSFYVDWYRNRPAPVCAKCARSLNSFTTDQADKDAVLVHNVHAWLDVLTDLQCAGEDARAWLSGERWRARDAHRDIGPPSTGAPIDALLDALCQLDGPPQQRQHVPTR